MYIDCSECLTILFILNRRRLIICYLVPGLQTRQRYRRASNRQYSGTNTSTSHVLSEPTAVLNNSDLSVVAKHSDAQPSVHGRVMDVAMVSEAAAESP